jgi:hypothetical protein
VKPIIGLLLPFLALAHIAAGGASHDDSRAVVLRVSDWLTSLKPTAGPNNVWNCLIVYPMADCTLSFGDKNSLMGMRA